MKRKKRALMLAVCHPRAVGGQAACARMLLADFSDVEWWEKSFPLAGQMKTFARILASMQILFSSLWICVSRRIDVVHVLTACGRQALFEKLILINVLKLTRVRIVLNFQGAFDEYYSRFSGREQWLIRKLLKPVDVVLLLHKDMEKYFTVNGIAPQEKIRVIPNAVTVYPPLPRSANSTEVPRVLYMGWVISNKGLRTLIKAAGFLAKDLEAGNFVLDIIGPDEEKGFIETLRKEAQDGGAVSRVHFHSPVAGDAKRKAFEAADVFVFPSRMEGFPFVLLEAMEAGLPVVATNISPMNLIVSHGETGLLFEKDNAADLAAKIKFLLQHPGERMRLLKAGREHIVANYSKDKIISMYADLYSDLI